MASDFARLMAPRVGVRFQIKSWVTKLHGKKWSNVVTRLYWLARINTLQWLIGENRVPENARLLQFSDARAIKLVDNTRNSRIARLEIPSN